MGCDEKMTFLTYPKIFAFGHDETKDLLSDESMMIVIQEKCDGSNFRYMFKDGNIIFGSRTQSLTSSTGEEVNVNKSFRRCLDHVKKTIPKAKLKEYEGLIFFGENMVKHSMDYDWDKIPPFLGFDILRIDSGNMLPFDESKRIFKDLGLDFVPIIDVKPADQITEINEKLIPVSFYAPRGNPSQKAEGIVLKQCDGNIMAKVVTERFKEVNAEVFGGIPKYQEDDSGKVVARYCTNARIEKIIFKLVDEGHKLEMAMMNHLPGLVNSDIWNENWQEIISKYSEIKPRSIRRMVAKRCVAVLNQIIINSALK